LAELSTPAQLVASTRAAENSKAELVDVTTMAGNAQVERKGASFEGTFRTEAAGRFAFLPDVGRGMGSRHSAEKAERVRIITRRFARSGVGGRLSGWSTAPKHNCLAAPRSRSQEQSSRDVAASQAVANS
jgi:hypothetical protein